MFTGIFADIGDEQSIEQSLSTFSSHMVNTINVLKLADSRALVLLDEVGAGTDPGEGSALARALLTHLRDRGVTTIVTTHHPELKIYGVETPGVRNASVEFDPQTLRPTYRLIIGLPGRSNALAIAARLGLDAGIVAAARHMVATEELVADDLLDEIQRTREEIRAQNTALRATLEDAEEQRETLQARLDQLDEERRDVIHAARRQAEEQLKAFQRELRRLRNELRAAGQPVTALDELQDSAEALSARLSPPQPESAPAEPDWVPRAGERVWLRTLKSEGVIRELDGEEALVQLGALRVRAGPARAAAWAQRKPGHAARRPAPVRSLARPRRAEGQVARPGAGSARRAGGGSAAAFRNLAGRRLDGRPALRPRHPRDGHRRAAQGGARTRRRSPANREGNRGAAE